MFSARAFVLALALGVTSASRPDIALYAPGSDVVPHANIDASANAMIKFLAGEDSAGTALDNDVLSADPKAHFVGAKDVYELGAESSSYVEYEGTVTTGSLSASKSDVICTGKKADGSTLILNQAGSFKTFSATKLKIYLDDAGNGCGLVPWQGGTALANYVAPYSEADCPAISNNAEITCDDSSTANEDFTFTATSIKLGGRSLKGFSQQAPAKMGPGGLNEPEYIAAQSFHDSGTYGDDHVQLALAALTAASGDTASFSTCSDNSGATSASCTGTFVQGSIVCKKTDTRAPFIPSGGTVADQKTNCESNGGKVSDFSARDDAFNIEVAKKMAVYTNAWLYTIHEFEDAIGDCEFGDIANNDDSVHAWDEGVAFYTGTLAGEKGYFDTTPKNGKMLYELANKRCQNYGTCNDPDDNTNGNSNVNDALFPNFVQGQFACHVGDCDKAQSILDDIYPQMKVPLVQGALRYAYKQDKLNGGEKEIGEGYAFMMSIVGAVHVCSETDAKIIYDALDMPDTGLGGGYTYADVKTAFENNYACMGFKCADVGALLMSDGTVYEGAEQCTDPDTSSDGLPTWGWVVIGCVGGLAVLLLLSTCYFRAQKVKAQNLYNQMQAESGTKK